jgi:GNAT superfamily N-acetyltransferase
MNAGAVDDDRVALANGCLVRIRPLQRGEDGVVRELFARLSLRTRYLRFFSPLPVLPDSLLRLLADVNDPRRLALVAHLDSADGGDVVALGNASAGDDGCAEVGLVVADAWQRRGIGTALATRLLMAAEHRGYRRFLVHGLLSNPALRPLMTRIAEVVSTSTRFGVSEIAFVRRRPGEVSTRAFRCLVDATPEGEAVYNASRELKLPAIDSQEQAYERMLAFLKPGGL